MAQETVEQAPPKYVVYPAGEHGARLLAAKPLDDDTFFVIRDTDALSTPALWAYSATLQTILEADRQREFLKAEERTHLEALEQHVTGLAMEWQRRGKGRLPD